MLNWLTELRRFRPKAFIKCRERIQLLTEHGLDLRRPHADYLEDSIYELRAKEGRVQYRILYALVGQEAVLLHAFSKEGAIPVMELQRAQDRRRAFASNPPAHTYEDDLPEERKR